ncbi:FAD-dependent oxidoreductase [Streptomyces jumonjinensis]|uniref:FAD-dependent oxidoreductase n=1 Tax=Streptomyces jumonjinensis TaxID=1945 RepID=A0A646KMD6_STRJU|nr:FAD-dependent oxidoreductase [Streptomyces jumonjinensis]MQT02146.1 FAD-dependent oxidoreductase [Streptomyces jumonjinensis]
MTAHRAAALDEGRILDAVVVGAGLAGLRAAHALRDLDVAVLEREDRPGGRVLTEHHGGYVFDLGAVLPYRAADAPSGFTPGPVRPGFSRLALVLAGRPHLGADPRRCLSACGQEKPSPPVLEALFQRIHVGSPAAYLPCRTRDAFLPYSTGFRRAGNGELVRAQLHGAARTPIVYGAAAERVDRRGGLVRVHCRDAAGVPRTVRARAAVVATTGLTARDLLARAAPTEVSRAFLASLRYGPATVCALAVRARPRLPWAYAVTPELPATMVLQRDMGPGAGTVFQAYFMAHKSAPAAALDDDELRDRTAGLLRGLGLWDGDGDGDGDGVLAHGVRRWPAAGVIIAPESYRSWNPAVRRPLPGVFLAGDYVDVRSGCPLPYGMTAAIASGREAAADVRAYLHASPLPDLPDRSPRV